MGYMGLLSYFISPPDPPSRVKAKGPGVWAFSSLLS